MEYNAELYANIVAAIAIAIYFGSLFVRAWRGQTGLQKFSALIVESLTKDTEEKDTEFRLIVTEELGDFPEDIHFDWEFRARFPQWYRKYVLKEPLNNSIVFEVCFNYDRLGNHGWYTKAQRYEVKGIREGRYYYPNGGLFDTSDDAIEFCQYAFKTMQVWLRK